ncbi:MAG: hypothetical protein IPJ82_15910 [Lewinellaceae bacterium]|nr:hypothetical protein [Lewinellaceae bacterium]
MWTLLDGFQNLEKNEIDALVEAPVLITILIGAADDNIDGEERKWTERLLRARTCNRPKELNEFYRVVVEGFWGKVQDRLSRLPAEVEARNEAISKLLGNLNPVLAKLDPELAADLYHGFISLAEETAKASGGFLRIGAISAAESRWTKLPMLTPIEHKPDKTEEEEED